MACQITSLSSQREALQMCPAFLYILSDRASIGADILRCRSSSGTAGTGVGRNMQIPNFSRRVEDSKVLVMLEQIQGAPCCPDRCHFGVFE